MRIASRATSGTSELLDNEKVLTFGVETLLKKPPEKFMSVSEIV